MKHTNTPIRWTCLLAILTCLIALPAYAQDRNRPDKPEALEQPERAERDNEGKPERKPGDRLAEWATTLKPLIAETQAFQTDSTNQLKVNVSYALPARGNEGGYHTFIVLRWGDLDNELTKADLENHANWDGSLTLTEGTATVVRELAFDDGERRRHDNDTPRPTPEEIKAKITERAENARVNATERIEDADKLQEVLSKISDHEAEALARLEEASVQHEELHEKLGELAVDELTSGEGPSQTVTWDSGVVGGTDGLLIRLDLPSAETTGTIVAGEFTFTFTTTEVPAETLDAWKEQHKPRQPRDDEAGQAGEDGPEGKGDRPRPHQRPENEEGRKDQDRGEGKPHSPRQPGAPRTPSDGK